MLKVFKITVKISTGHVSASYSLMRAGTNAYVLLWDAQLACSLMKQ